jgi:dedicated sortase system histidine kinase
MLHLRIGLRAKLLLVTAALAAIPLVGLGYVREMEILLREQQEQNLLAAARAVATALNDRPAMQRLRPRPTPPQLANPVATPPSAPPAAPLQREPGAPPPAQPGGETAVATPVAASPAPADAPTTSPGSLPPPASSTTPPTTAPASPAASTPVAQTATAQASPPPQQPAPPSRLIATEESVAPEQMSEEIDVIVASLNRARSRIWVVDRKRQLLGLAGSLRGSGAPVTAPDRPASAWERFEEAVLRPLYQRILQRPNDDFDDSLPETAISSGPEVERALTGIAGARWRATPDNRAVVVSAAHPVFAGDSVVAAVVVEETTNAIQSFTARAFEKLISATLAVFVIVAVIMLLFASRLANRVVRLRDEAESAVDAHGRVRALTTASSAGDEIGDLSRSFSQLLERLAQYHDYLENMGARLTHEFRTPVAVVRSSLDNLAMQDLPEDARQYMRRAEEGLARLNKLITRLSEARRLEHALREGERVIYDAREVVAGCVEGYRAAFPHMSFETRIMAAPARVDGSPDLLAQALDKLAANAVSFGRLHTPVLVTVRADEGGIVIEVENTGPPLPDASDDPQRARLFDSMISLRDGAADSEPHLGLGLYVVRLVAEFHLGTASARNRPDGSGVVVGMRLPFAP